MKAIIEFSLPEEKHEHEIALKAMDYQLALSDFDEYLRNKIKYEPLKDDHRELCEEIRTVLHQLTEDLVL